MPGPKDPTTPTVPPPFRRRPEVRAEEEIEVEVEPISSDPQELALRELKDVELRTKARLKAQAESTQRAITELSEVFERRVKALETEIQTRDELIRKLQKADTEALLDHEGLRELVAAMGRRLSVELSASVTTEVKQQLTSKAAAEGAEAGENAGRSAGSKAGAKWTPIAGFIGAIIAAAVSTGAQKCSADDSKPKPAVTTPAPGAGYGGRL